MSGMILLKNDHLYYDPLYNKSLNQNYGVDFKIQSSENTFKGNINFIFDKIINLKDKI